jgi:tRNA pseudouridine13 synthase
LRVSAIEKHLGIETFVTKTRGVGGAIKQTAEDFVVEEVFVDGSMAEFEPKQPSEIAGEGRYLICLLVKQNWDTLLAVRKIAKYLGISERRVRIAGIKDKKALTAQHISIENIAPERLKRVRVNGMDLYPLRYSSNMVFPHMLFGNVFQITIRGISHSARAIRERMSSITNQLEALGGVANFFGHQRFGTVRPITHLVGKAFAQNNLEKAAFLFLAEPSPHEHPQSREARQRLLETGDFEEALDYFPRRLLYERLMLAHLTKNSRDYVGAFKRLPQRLRLLLLQAYQSYLFNRFLSQRLLEKIPVNEPQVGDYVMRTDSHRLPTNSYIVATLENLQGLRDAVRKREMYVAIPLIGFKQAFSEGAQGEIEKAILESEGITQNDFRVPSMREMSAAGELRAVVTPIMDLVVEKSTSDELNPGMKKLCVRFTLYRGSYATVVLREFMKPRNLIKAGF